MIYYVAVDTNMNKIEIKHLNIHVSKKQDLKRQIKEQRNIRMTEKLTNGQIIK